MTSTYDKHVLEFNLSRSYYDLINKKQYINEYNKILQLGINLFPKNTIDEVIYTNTLCIMSYNVRYFTNIKDEPIIDGIVDTILEYEPHVVCLQEVALGQNHYYKNNTFFGDNFDRLLEKYQIISLMFCTPAFYTSMYGNMVLIHKNIIQNMLSSINHDVSNIRNVLCTTSMNKCYFNQQIHNYDNVPSVKCANNLIEEFGKSVPCSDKSHLAVVSQLDEQKCFIKISLPYFDIICVHLSAYHTQSRIEQLNQINKKFSQEKP